MKIIANRDTANEPWLMLDKIGSTLGVEVEIVEEIPMQYEPCTKHDIDRIARNVIDIDDSEPRRNKSDRKRNRANRWR